MVLKYKEIHSHAYFCTWNQQKNSLKKHAEEHVSGEQPMRIEYELQDTNQNSFDSVVSILIGSPVIQDLLHGGFLLIFPDGLV